MASGRRSFCSKEAELGNSNNNAIPAKRDPRNVIPIGMNGMVYYIPADNYKYHLEKLIKYGGISQWFSLDTPQQPEQHAWDLKPAGDESDHPPNPPPSSCSKTLSMTGGLRGNTPLQDRTNSVGQTINRSASVIQDIPVQSWHQTRLAWEQAEYSRNFSLTSSGEEEP